MNGQFRIGDIQPKRYFYTVAVTLGLLFAMVSTDESRAFQLIFLQWQLQTVIPMVFLIASHGVINKYNRLKPWPALFASGLLGASLFVPIGVLIDSWLEPNGSTDSFISELVDEWFGAVPTIAVAWLLINAPWLMGYEITTRKESINTAGNSNEPVDIGTGNPTQESFLSLLPPNCTGDVIYLKSELHYLSVVTETGRALILYNLKDAIAELAQVKGHQVHRSYWAAASKIIAYKKQGRQGELILQGRHSIPISRNKLTEIESLYPRK